MRLRQTTFISCFSMRHCPERSFVDEARGVNIHHMGRAGLAQFHIPVPPIEGQQEIVRRIKAVFRTSEKLVVETSRATQLLDRLDQATLAKAFRSW